MPERGVLDVLRELGAALLLGAVMVGAAIALPPAIAGGVLVTVLGVYAFRRVLFTWPTALMIVVLLVMLVPIRRYSLQVPLPFALEPYRVFLVVLIVLMLLTLLTETGGRWRPVGIGWPIAVFLLSLWISIVANGTSLVESGMAMRSLLALVEMVFFLCVFFLARIILTSESHVMRMLTLMVWCAVIVSFFAVVERATGFNIFLHLHTFLPLELLQEGNESVRAGGARSYGSAQHPIALGVALAMMLPVAVYLGKYSSWPRNEISRQILYGLGAMMMLAGTIVAVSRTSVVVLGAMFLITLILQPRLGLLLTMIGVPLFLLGSALVPDVFEETVWAFFNPEELIASQHTSPGWRGAGRLADLDPAFALIREDPYFGTGHGSRITVGDDANAFILDNQFLATLMEGGGVGVAGLVALFVVPAIQLFYFAFSASVVRRHTMLAFTIGVATVGYVAAMFFYDAFAFMQTFMMQMLLFAAGAWVMTEAPRVPRFRSSRDRPQAVAAATHAGSSRPALERALP